jgi:hypothetical protein
MSRSSEDETQKLSGRSSPDIELSVTDNEQKRGLLSDATKGLGDEAYENRSLRSRAPVIWWTTFVTLFTLGTAGAVLWMLRGWPQKELHGDGARPVIQTNDYVLDPNWDNLAPPQRREFTWSVRDHVHNPDGIFRPMILVNNMYPGPCIEANEGDTIVVHVDNRASNATAIHWHGIYQSGSPHMDGTVGVTQLLLESLSYTNSLSLGNPGRTGGMVIRAYNLPMACMDLSLSIRERSVHSRSFNTTLIVLCYSQITITIYHLLYYGSI